MKKLIQLILLLPLTVYSQSLDSCYSIIDFYDEYYESSVIEVNLQEGWNMFGVTCEQPQETVSALEIYVDEIIIVKDNEGNVYLPEFGFNNIDSLIPGLGYQVKLLNSIDSFSLCPTPTIPQAYGCTDCFALNFDQWATIDDGTCHYLTDGYDEDGNLIAQIGDYFQGGIIFYIDSTGQHGLIAATEDLPGTYEWGCMDTLLMDSLESTLYGGAGNTSYIVSSGCHSESGGEIAAQAVMNYELNGYDDWYLPSIDELGLLLQFNETIVGGELLTLISNGIYMTSNDSDLIQQGSYFAAVITDDYWDLFVFGVKNDLNSVRPIRSF